MCDGNRHRLDPNVDGHQIGEPPSHNLAEFGYFTEHTGSTPDFTKSVDPLV